MKNFLRHITVPLLIMVIAPLFAAWILCLTFGDGVVTEVPYGIIDMDQSALSRMLVHNIEENNIFDVQFYGSTPDELEDAIYYNQILAGVIIPRDFSKDVTAGKSPTVLIVYDGCQMSAVGISKVKLNEVMMTIKAAASIQVMEARLNLQPDEALLYAQPISTTYRYLGNPERSIGNYVLPCTIASIVQLSAYLFVVEAIRKEENETVHPLVYSLIGTVVATMTLLVCIWFMYTYFTLPMNGSWWAVLCLSLLNMFGICNLAAIVRILAPRKLMAEMSAVIIMAMLLFSGATFPAIAMPRFFQWIAAILPFTYFAIPLRDVLLLGKNAADVMTCLQWLFWFAAGTAVLVTLLWLLHHMRCIRKKRKQNTGTDNCLDHQPEQEVLPLC